jgi:hypothetical protein
MKAGVKDCPHSGQLYYAAKGREIKRNVSSHVLVRNPMQSTGFVSKQSGQFQQTADTKVLKVILGDSGLTTRRLKPMPLP